MDFIWEKCETAIRGLLEENSLRWLVIEALFGCLQWLSALACYWKPGNFMVGRKGVINFFAQNFTPAWLSTCSCSILLLLLCNLQHTDSSGGKPHTH
jgi:hypothetical protein